MCVNKHTSHIGGHMKCTSCKNDKPNSEFRKNVNFKHRGELSYQCKSCDLNKKQTPEGRLVIMYNSTRSASRGRGASTPAYTHAELSKWAYSNGYMKVYNKWKKSDYNKNDVPSVDRIDPKEPYSLGNIQIVPWSINNSRNVSTMSAPVTRSDLNGRNPKQFTSVRSAARSLSATNSGGGILRALKSNKPAHGYLWAIYNKE